MEGGGRAGGVVRFGGGPTVSMYRLDCFQGDARLPRSHGETLRANRTRARYRVTMFTGGVTTGCRLSEESPRLVPRFPPLPGTIKWERSTGGGREFQDCFTTRRFAEEKRWEKKQAKKRQICKCTKQNNLQNIFLNSAFLFPLLHCTPTGGQNF